MHLHSKECSHIKEKSFNGSLCSKPPRDKKSLFFVLVLSLILLVVEIVAGFLTNSLALLSDAGHLFTDVGSMCLALFAMWMAGLPPTPKKTFGYYRMEILAALFNGVTLILLAFLIFFEASKRLAEPPEVHSSGMIAVAVLGLLVNVTGLYLLKGEQHKNLNLHGVFLHILGDTLSSVGTMAAGIIMKITHWYYADPIASILIALIIVFGAVELLNHSVNVLMEGVPHGVNSQEILLAIQKLPGVVEVHDLHIWTLTSGVESLSMHVLIEEYAKGEPLLEEIHKMIGEKFKIDHITIQIEKNKIEERYRHTL